MSMTSRLAAPLVVSFGLMASTALAQEPETLSFQCDMPDLSSMSLTDRVDTVMPGNVFIRASSIPEANEAEGEAPAVRTPPRSSLGSGYIIDTRGYIVTNNHVIGDNNRIMISLYDPEQPGHVGEEVTASVVGVDAELDVAVLKIDYEGDLTCVNFGDSDELRRADTVFAIGNPLGLPFTYTQGAISHPQQQNPRSLYDFIQTDAAVNRGNSGGALYNSETGQVIGMNTAIVSPNGGNIGIAFASASNDIVDVVDDLIRYGEVRRGALGVGIQDVNEKTAEEMNVIKGKGVLVTGIAPDGPAAQGGIQKSDIILEVNGKKVNSSQELARTIATYDPDEVVKLKILRDGVKQNVDIILGERKVTLESLKPSQGPFIIPEDELPLPSPDGEQEEIPPALEEFFKRLFPTPPGP